MGLTAGGGFAGDGDDGGKLFGFLQEWGDQRGRGCSMFLNEFEPELGFVRFLFDNAELGNEFGFGAALSSRAIVCCHGGC